MSINFSDPQQYIITTTQQIALFLAGVGSGKTYVIGFLSGYLLKYFPDVFGFIGANTHHQLNTSTMFRTREVWFEIFGWKEGIDYVVGKIPPRTFNTEKHNFKDYNGIVSFKWGAICFIGSLDNAAAHDGKEFGYAFLDETKDSREVDVKETILTRLRMLGIFVGSNSQLTQNKIDPDTLEENTPFNPLYILTSPARVRWLNEWFEIDDMQEEILAIIYSETEFFKKEFKDKSLVISSTYHNSDNLPSNYIDKILNNNKEAIANKLIYGNPFVKSGNEFYSSFQRKVHVKRVEYNPELPIHVSFDQNVAPYITATVYQVEFTPDIIYVRQLDEICLENPRNKTDKLCLELIRRHGSKLKVGLFFYGDPSGKKSDTRGEHDYRIVERVLRPYLNNNSNRVPFKHPPVLKRKDFINNALEGKYNVQIEIDPRCKNSILDFEFLKEDKNGKKLKETVKDKDKGVSYEMYGHTSDSFDYFFCEILKRLFLMHFG